MREDGDGGRRGTAAQRGTEDIKDRKWAWGDLCQQALKAGVVLDEDANVGRHRDFVRWGGIRNLHFNTVILPCDNGANEASPLLIHSYFHFLKYLKILQLLNLDALSEVIYLVNIHIMKLFILNWVDTVFSLLIFYWSIICIEYSEYIIGIFSKWTTSIIST